MLEQPTIGFLQPANNPLGFQTSQLLDQQPTGFQPCQPLLDLQ